MNRMKKISSLVLAGALALSLCQVTVGRAEVKTNDAEFAAAEAASGGAAGVASGGAATVSGPSLNLTSVNRMAGKSFKLTLSYIPAGAVSAEGGLAFVTDDESVAVVTESAYSTDFSSMTATIKLVAKGSTKVHVSLGGEEYSCDVHVVSAITKEDFGRYNVKNFVTNCQKNPKWDWAWTGEWGIPNGKYGSTCRGIKIGDTLEDVKNAYGELKLKKCKRAESGKKGDPFLYIAQFNKGKKLKVSKYTDMNYGKFKLRFYFTPSKEVFGFTMTMNFVKLTKTGLKRQFKLKMI